MLLRDLQEHLRRRFGLLASDRMARGARSGAAAGQNAHRATRERRQDFAPFVPPVEAVRTPVLVVRRGFSRAPTVEEGYEVYLRTRARNERINPVGDGIERGALVYADWHDAALAWFIDDLTNGVWRAEAFEALDRKRGVKPLVKLAETTHVKKEAKPAAVLPPGAAVGKGRNWAIDTTPYRVPEDSSWINWTGDWQFMGYGWEYDLDDGTPQGEVDFRAVRRNGNGLTDEYPPPTRTGEVRATRWSLNWAWEPDNITSPKFRIEYRPYSIGTGPPADRPMNVDWTAIDTTPQTFQRSVQSMDYEPSSVRYRPSEGLSIALRKVANATVTTRYRYTCTFTVGFQGGGSEQREAALHIVERLFVRAHGVRTVTPGGMVHDDIPNGIESMLRVDEGGFPSNGGAIALQAPATGHTFRGLSDASRSYAFQGSGITGHPGGRTDTGQERFAVLNYVLLDEAGDFWVAVWRDVPAIPYELRIARRGASSAPITEQSTQEWRPHIVRITRAGSKLWLNGTQVS